MKAQMPQGIEYKFLEKGYIAFQVVLLNVRNFLEYFSKSAPAKKMYEMNSGKALQDSDTNCEVSGFLCN